MGLIYNILKLRKLGEKISLMEICKKRAQLTENTNENYENFGII